MWIRLSIRAVVEMAFRSVSVVVRAVRVLIGRRCVLIVFRLVAALGFDGFLIVDLARGGLGTPRGRR